MKDRVSLYPGRIRLIPVEGQDNVYDLVRADEPIEEGTPLNKVNLLKDSTIQKYVNATINVPDDVFNYLGNYAEYWWKRINAGIVSYVHSTDRTAYPDTGELNGFSYEYAGIPFENMSNIPVKIETGSYVGTGTRGSSNPNSLTFGFVPKFLIIYPNSSGSTTIGLYLRNNGYMSGYIGNMNTEYNNKVSWSDRTMTWYASKNSEAQLNNPNQVYNYVAIG